MRRFGLIGKELEHSFSPTYFRKKFKNEGIKNATYEAYSISDISLLKETIENNKIQGFNITIPYKEAIIPYVSLSNIALEVGAVNCVLVQNASWIAYNTDVIGFENSFLPFLKPWHQKALIFGTGGAAKAVAWVLDRIALPYYYVSRNPKNINEISYKAATSKFPFVKVLINTTPIGMYPNEDKELLKSYEGVSEKHFCYDVIYNPKETPFLKACRKRGAFTKNGEQMLQIQADESWRIWNFNA